MAKLFNLAGMSTATTGTGTITLGSAMYGHLTFAQAGVQDGDLVGYAVKDGAASEVGYGVYTASGTTLTRTVRKSTNSDAAINLSGSAEVFIAPAAEDFLPLSSGAELGLLTNPFFEISQENGTNLQTSIFPAVYSADQWRHVEACGALAASVQVVADPFSGASGFKRLKSSAKVVITADQASLASGEFMFPIHQPIEGTFFRSLGWGTSDARSVTLAAVVAASVTGTYSVAIRDAVGSRSWVTTVDLVANTPTVIYKIIPGDVGGSWVTTNATAAFLFMFSVAGSTYETATLDAWQSGNYFSATTSTDWQGTNGAFVQIGYCQLFPAGVLPWSSAAEITGEALQQLLNIRRPYDYELRLCQRYWCSTYAAGVTPGTATSAGAVKRLLDATQSYASPGIFEYPAEMRSASPVVTVYSPLDGTIGAMVSDGTNKSPVQTEAGAKRCFAFMDNVSIGQMSSLSCHITVNARM